MSISLIAVWIVDKAVTGLLVAQGHRIVSDIPGVHVEAISGARGIRVINAPSYWLLTIIYILLIGVAGNLAGRLYTTLQTREREVDNLRENLLTQVQDTAAQQERNRLARELHDSIKQQIFSISMSAAAAEARWKSDPQGAQAALGDLRSVAHEAMVEMNALLQQLSPAPLEKVGLVQALRDQCEALGYRTGAQVTAEFGALPPNDRLPIGAQESLFRIVQEAFSNTARHARAEQVKLYLGLNNDENALVLRIEDDGQGFDPEAVKEGMGLDNIRQRVRSLDGKLTIESDLDQGTKLHATIPLMKPSTQKDAVPKQDHTLNKVCLIGLAGGLALIAMLFYPLYTLLPSDYISGWATGSQLLGLALEIAAALAAITTGFLAARWAKPGSRQAGATFGALAGSVASLTFYLGIGATAAGLVGQGTLLRHGLVSAAGDNDLARLIVGATVGTIWWTYATLWAALLAGIGLGAVGGLLSPVTTESVQPVQKATMRTILVQGAWVSVLLLIFTITIVPLLASTIQDRIIIHAIPLETILPPQGVSLWPVGSAAIFYLVPLVTLYFLSRSEINTKDPIKLYTAQTTAIVFGLIAAGMGFYLLIPTLIYSSTALGALLIGTTTVSLVMGGGFLAIFARIRRQRRKLGLTRRLHAIRIVAAICVIWNLGMIIWGVGLPLGWATLVGLAVVIIDIALLVILRRQPRQPAPTTITLQGLQQSVSQMLNASLGAIVAMIAPVLAPVGAGVSLVTILVRLIAILADYSESQLRPSFTLIQLARNAYLAQGRAAIIVFVGGTAAVGLLILAISGIMAFVKYRASRDS
jgi:signal transduction histidine kinase